MTPKPHLSGPALASLFPGHTAFIQWPPVLTTFRLVSCSFRALSSRRLAMTASSAFFRFSLRTFSSVSGSCSSSDKGSARIGACGKHPADPILTAQALGKSSGLRAGPLATLDEGSPSLGQGSCHLPVAPTGKDVHGMRRRRMLRQKDRVSESAFPQLRPGPRTRLPSLTSIWFSSLRVAQRCCSSPRALSSSGLGLSPKPMSNVPWCGKGQATGPQKATLPSHSSPAAAQGDRETRRFSHIPALRVQRRRSRRGRSPVLPAHTVTPRRWHPLWLSPVLPIPAHLLLENASSRLPGP